MGDVINLRQARKRRDRADREAAASANRAKFGRTKAEKVQAREESARAARSLDGHRRDDAPEAERSGAVALPVDRPSPACNDDG